MNVASLDDRFAKPNVSFIIANGDAETVVVMQQQPGAVVIDLNLFRERRSQERERARLASALASPPPIALVALWAPMLLVPSAYGWGIGWSGMPALYGVGV